MPISSNSDNALAGLTIKLKIIQGKDLEAKDKSMFRGDSSDPFIRIYIDNQKKGYTKTCYKTLEPEWNQNFVFRYGAEEVDSLLENNHPIRLEIFDKDQVSFSDPMGHVSIALDGEDGSQPEPVWLPVEGGSGEVLVGWEIIPKHYLKLTPGQSHAIKAHKLRVSMAWDVDASGWKGVKRDLDVACVCVDKNGEVDLKNCVYYGNIWDESKSIRHSGDDTTGEGEGWDERIICNMKQIPNDIYALYFILSAAGHDQTLSCMQKAEMKLINDDTGMGICRMTNEDDFGDATSYFLIRLARNVDTGHWFMAPMGLGVEGYHDFGTLIPQIQAFSRDVVPNVKPDPFGRMAILRKEGVMRIKDYVEDFPSNVTFGLRWNFTPLPREEEEEEEEEKEEEEKEEKKPDKPVNLDISIICLDKKYKEVEIISRFNKEDEGGAIRHSGEGTKKGLKSGDNEEIRLYLGEIDPDVHYLVFVVNSVLGYRWKRLDGGFSCRLYASGRDEKPLAFFQLEKTEAVMEKTAMLVGCLYRGSSGDDEDWNYRAMTVAADGKYPKRNVDEAQNFLQKKPIEDPKGLPELDEEALEECVMPTAEEVESEEEEEEEDIVVSEGGGEVEC